MTCACGHARTHHWFDAEALPTRCTRSKCECQQYQDAAEISPDTMRDEPTSESVHLGPKTAAPAGE